MNTRLTNLLLSLALAGFFVAGTGCEPWRGGDYATSHSGFAFALDWLPDFGSYDTYESYDEFEYVEDDGFYYEDDGFDAFDDFGFFDDGFYDDGFYDGGFYDDWDDWKRKNGG